MKYNILEKYQCYLILCGLRPNTVRIYYHRMSQLLDNQYIIEDGNKIDVTKVITNMNNILYKNHFSQNKNALLYFLECYQIALTKEQLEIINQFEKKTKKKYRKQNELPYKRILNTIQHLKNKTLRLSYLILIETGIRVFELSQIRGKDCKIHEDKIQVSFIGKGGRIETSNIDKKNNPKLYNELKGAIETLQTENDTLFYSVNYLQKKAKFYGFACHDLRRISAQLEYRKTKSKYSVQQKLRHNKIKTTNIYLTSPIKFK